MGISFLWFPSLVGSSAQSPESPKRRRGRPRKPRPLPPTLATGLRRPGRPRRYNGNEIVELIDERRTAAQNQGRSLSRPEALAELLAEVLKKRNPAKFNKIEEYRK